MPMSADQAAVLEMLLTGGQSYDDLDDLFALEEGDARERARAALEELGGADPDRKVGLTDFLLGQADPIGRADAVRHLRQDDADAALASGIVSELEDHFPDAELPKIPRKTGGGRFGGRSASTPAQPAGEQKPAKSSSFDPRQTRTMALLGGGALILLIVVLAIAGVFSGGGDESVAPTGTDAAATPNPDDGSSPLPGQEVVRVPLAPPGGNGDAGGAAVVGVTDSSQPYLDLVISNLQPPPNGLAYIAWFMFDRDTGYPLTQPIVPGDGNSFQDRIAIPAAVSGAIARATSIEISLSDPQDIIKQVQDAVDQNTIAIERPGKTILKGTVPQPGSAGTDQPAPGESQGGG